MTFEEVLNQALALLQRQGRVSYRALKRQFSLDDAYLEDLKKELIGAKRLAADEDGRFLVWTGGETEGEKAKRKKTPDSGPRTPDFCSVSCPFSRYNSASLYRSPAL